jgi:hypothetical protein
VPTYIELRNLEHRLEDTYQHHGHHPKLTRETHVNPAGEIWREHYFARRAGGMNHEQAMRSIESQIDVIEGRPDRWAAPQVTGAGGGGATPVIGGGGASGAVTPLTAAGRVGFSRVEGVWWADDAGSYTPLDLSMLYAGSDGVDARPLMDQAAEIGFDGARIFGGRLTPSNARSGQAPEAMPARIASLAGELQARGLELQVPMLTDTGGPRYDEAGHVAAMTRAAIPCPNIRLLQVLNEIGHGSQRTFTTGEIRALAADVTQLGWSRALDAGAALWHDEIMPPGEWPGALLDGATRQTGHIYPPAEIGNVTATHYNRGRWPFYANVAHGANELRILAQTYDKARSSSEPGRTDHPDVGGQHIAYGYALGISATGFGTRTVIHSSQGRDARTPLSGAELDAARAAIRGHRALPRGRYEFFNAHNTGAWPHSPIKSAAFVDGPASSNAKTVWRAWSFRHTGTGQWFLVLLGPSVDQPGLQFQHGFGLDAQVDRLDNLVHVWTMKQG